MTLIEGVVHDGELDRVGQRLVLATSGFPGLAVVDPIAGTVSQVDTSFSATRVSLSPSGAQAVLAHDGRITVVDLNTLQAAPHIDMGIKVSDVVAADNGYAYVWSVGTGNHADAFSVALATEEIASWPSGGIPPGVRAVLHPSAAAIFATDSLSGDLLRYDITGGELASASNDELVESPFCGDIWLSDMGDLGISSCGYVHELTESGSIGQVASLLGDEPTWQIDGPRLVSAWHAASAQQLGVLHRPGASSPLDEEPPGAYRELAIYDTTAFDEIATLAIPCVHADPIEDASFEPRLVFGGEDGDAYFVVMASTDRGESVVVTMAAP